ncbi:GNAT family N-acetyltransferase [Spirulina sp. 06S082]|uniref:GNAT family N-acetyltransferase n=1 Tax=Spirulina sp. 06S082 TaxID=3110248 RepID=UPI002B209B70|nr:GNAT family N-acetyltransferase [Spirulina sp. 06S082]MEA5467816.1 GNAT family N-acetyltransferase [Spirulina sp. 06S082]
MSNLEIKIVSYSEERQILESIRKQVFQEEQNVPFELEFDGQDETAEHFLAYWQGKAIGTVRLRFLEPQTAKIERLAVLKEARGKNIGKQLMQAVLERAVQKQAKQAIINAQLYIKGLYLKLGFEPVGEQFTEAGIPHLKMIKKF